MANNIEKLFETHKDLVWTAIVILSILLCLNFYNDETFRVVGPNSPLIIILLIAGLAAFLVGMTSGYSSSKKGTHTTADTANTTTNVIGAFALSFGIMLAANLLGGHEGLKTAEFCIGGIALVIIIVILSPLAGPSSHKAGNRHNRAVINAHSGTSGTLEVNDAQTDEEKSSKTPWIIAGILFLLICFALSHSGHNNESPVTMLPANSSTTTTPVVTTTTTTVTTPEKEAGYE